MPNLLSQNEIDLLMQAVRSGDLPRSGPKTGRTPARRVLPRSNSAKSYDFRHPVVFLKEQLRAIQAVHEDYSRALVGALASSLRIAIQAKCIAVDQLSYAEFVKSQQGAYTAIKFGISPAETRGVLVVQSAITSGILDKTLGGTGAADEITRPFTDIERVVIDDLIVTLIRELQPAWSRSLKLSFAVESVENNIDLCEVARKEEMAAVVTIEAGFGETRGIVSVCYPFRALTSFIDKVSAGAGRTSATLQKGGKNTQLMEAAVNGIPLKLSARLGMAQITMKDLLRIKSGDVLLLNRALDQPVELEIGGKMRLTGHLGTHHGKKAILVEQRLA